MFCLIFSFVLFSLFFSISLSFPIFSGSFHFILMLYMIFWRFYFVISDPIVGIAPGAHGCLLCLCSFALICRVHSYRCVNISGSRHFAGLSFSLICVMAHASFFSCCICQFKSCAVPYHARVGCSGISVLASSSSFSLSISCRHRRLVVVPLHARGGLLVVQGILAPIPSFW